MFDERFCFIARCVREASNPSKQTVYSVISNPSNLTRQPLSLRITCYLFSLSLIDMKSNEAEEDLHTHFNLSFI